MSKVLTLGASYQGDGKCRFLVWAPRAASVAVHLLTPAERLTPLQPAGDGYHEAVLDGVAPGSLYYYRLDDTQERPDPASRCQPQDVHGPSRVEDRQFPWEDQCWCGLPLIDYLLYEIHVGTFTPEGTFEAIIPRLPALRELGVTALELMPVAQFPGSRNWGYDGAYPFAVQASYGGPAGLKKLINACHRLGLAVVLDVVYNHLGPEGNYLGEYGYYFSDRYRTPWGRAINFDGPHSDDVRRYFIENALSWVTDYHVDALRLDALHAIVDASPMPFLAELAAAVQQQAERLNRHIYLMGESDLNEARLIRRREVGGLALDVHWNDDFHHALHCLLTSETAGYYQDFGRVRHLAKAFREGFIYSGQYSAFRKRRQGSPSGDLPPWRFLVFSQNHDQVGNRLHGERLSRLTSFEGLKMAAAATLLSPFLPMIFMGEEYGEAAPFHYFVSHHDPDLVAAVRRGRKEEFAGFIGEAEPPDPQAEETFLGSKPDWTQRTQGRHGLLLELYRELIRLRRDLPALTQLSQQDLEVMFLEKQQVLVVRRRHEEQEAIAIWHFGKAAAAVTVPLPAGSWSKRLDTAAERWGGPGSGTSAQVEVDGEATLKLAPQSCVLLCAPGSREI
jgi:maltooligosyltrehalose trehalohydrolase